MIFATVGTQLPFDRLLTALDAWAALNPTIPVFAQVGASKGDFRHIETTSHLSQSDFRARFQASDLIVSHAGMGTILSAAELGKPVLLMPRRSAFGEHRNDHQIDTAREMARLSNVTIAEDANDLRKELDRCIAQGFAKSPTRDGGVGGELGPLLDVISAFVWDRPTVPAKTQADKPGKVA